MESDLKRIFSSCFQTLVTFIPPYSAYPSVRLSVIDIFCPFNSFLFLNTLFRLLYWTNFTIIGRVFPLVFLASPIRWVLSKSHNVISRSNFSFRVLIITSSVISSFSSAIPCTRRHFLLEYCSCWS